MKCCTVASSALHTSVILAMDALLNYLLVGTVSHMQGVVCCDNLCETTKESKKPQRKRERNASGNTGRKVKGENENKPGEQEDTEER